MMRAHPFVVLALCTACAGSTGAPAREVTGVAGSEDAGEGLGEDASSSTGAGSTTHGGTAGTHEDGGSDGSSGAETAGSSDAASSGGGAEPCDEVCAIPPAQWSGPVLLARAEHGPASCDDATYGLAQVTGYGDVQAADALCACTCDVGSEIICDDEVTLNVGAISCLPAQTQALTLQQGCTDVPDLAPGNHYAIEVGWSGGSCVANQSKGMLPPTYGEQFALCSANHVASGGCEGSAACLPAPVEPAPLCWWSEGDVECPGGWDATREVIYTEPVQDSRDCTMCSCAAPTGSCDHPGVVLVGANDICNLGQVPPATAVVGTGDCVTYGAQLQSVYAVADATPNTSCAVASDAEPIGEVTPQGPVTVCCAQ